MLRYLSVFAVIVLRDDNGTCSAGLPSAFAFNQANALKADELPS